MTDQPTHHGYAVNVKDHAVYGATLDTGDQLADDKVQELYEARQADFWEHAGEIAQEHGFRGVYSEGRMGGWCVPQPQPDHDGWEGDAIEEWERDRFEPFERAIRELMRACVEEFVADVRTAIEEKQRTERHNELAVKGWRY